MSNIKQKLITILLLLSITFTFFPNVTRAGAWGESMLAAQWTISMNQMLERIKETIIASLKMQAIQIIQTRLSSLLNIGGANGGSLIIANWQQFIYGSANKYSTMIVNDFFDSVSSGIPNPLAERVMTAKMAIIMAPKKPDLQNYVREGRADKIFTSGWAQNPKVAWMSAAAPQNDPGYWWLQGVVKEKAEYDKQVSAKIAEGISGQGYQSKDSSAEGTYQTTINGKMTTVPAGSNIKPQNITVPGSNTKDLVSKIKSIPMDMLAFAKSIPEVAVGIATQVMTQMLNQGIVAVSNEINKQLGGKDYIIPVQSITGIVGSSVSQAGTQTINASSTEVKRMIQKGLK